MSAAAVAGHLTATQPWAELLKYGSEESNKELIQLGTKY